MPSTTPRSKKSAKKTETAMKLRSPSRWTFSRRSSSRARAKASSSRPRGSLATIVSSSQTEGPAGKRSRFDPPRAIHYLRFRTPAAVFRRGSKEGIGHLALAMLGPGDVVLCPSPTYPIHQYSVIIAGGDLRTIPLLPGTDFLASLQDAVRTTWPKPKALIINFPHNPTTEVVELDFFRGIVEFAREHECLVVHDLAYADLCFDGYRAPSFLQVPGAKEIGVEFFTLTKSYNMPGWRVGFMVGNREIVGALARVKSYLDYGIFQPVQIAATHALNGPQHYVQEICETYRKRRNVLCDGLDRLGWHVPRPKATMFVWAEIPDAFKAMGSLEFSKLLLKEAKIAVSPGIGFGEHGDHYVRFALIENEHRTRQAVRGIRRALAGGLAPRVRASAG